MVQWKCRCDCGGYLTVRAANLSSGNTNSCGCWKREFRRANETHGMKGTRTYGIWNQMKQRCSNANVPNFHLYGGRGISVCNRWHQFENFYADMGPCPPGRSLERINNDGNYEPGNCRWATKKEQGRNKRNNRHLEHDGRTLTISEWSEVTKIPAYRISERINVLGWSVQDALTKPVRAGRYGIKPKHILSL
jgi:hypothetical protein